MRTIHRRSLLLASMAGWTFAASGCVQQRASRPLNTLEVRPQVARVDTADRGRLAMNNLKSSRHSGPTQFCDR